MRPHRGAALGAALLLAAAAGLPGCQTAGRAVDRPAAAPPLAELVAPPSFLTPRSQRYRLAVQPFVDATGRAEALAEAAGDVLLTALDADGRFSIYDASAELDLAPGLETVRPPASPDVAAAPAGSPAPAPSVLRPDVYEHLAGMVDGVLECRITAMRSERKGRRSFDVDYRVVDPYSRMVVTSGSASIGQSGDAPVRADFDWLAQAIGQRFVSPERMAARELAVREVSLDGPEVKLTLDGGLADQVARGAVGFVVEPDQHARLDRYLAKFVVVSVFESASVGVVVEHCNAVGRCDAGQAVAPIEQARNVHVGSRIRFK